MLMAPGWKVGVIETSHCWSTPLQLAVLPHHARHFAVLLVPKTVVRNTAFDIVVAGQLPIRALTASLSTRAEVVVDDGAYYFLANRNNANILTLTFPGEVTLSPIRIDISNAVQRQMFRRDITIHELLARSPFP
jgi:hypothetical protein